MKCMGGAGVGAGAGTGGEDGGDDSDDDGGPPPLEDAEATK